MLGFIIGIIVGVFLGFAIHGILYYADDTLDD